MPTLQELNPYASTDNGITIPNRLYGHMLDETTGKTHCGLEVGIEAIAQDSKGKLHGGRDGTWAEYSMLRTCRSCTKKLYRRQTKYNIVDEFRKNLKELHNEQSISI